MNKNLITSLRIPYMNKNSIHHYEFLILTKFSQVYYELRFIIKINRKVIGDTSIKDFEVPTRALVS